MGCTHSNISQNDSSYNSHPSAQPRDERRVTSPAISQHYGTLPREFRAEQTLHSTAASNCHTQSFTYTIRWYPDLTVIFRLNHFSKVEAFCVHQSNEIAPSYDQAQNFTNHIFFDLQKSTGPPRRLYCYSRQSRICYVAAREIYALLIAGVRSPDLLNAQLVTALRSVATRCTICRRPQGAAVHRPTLCSSIQCLREYLHADLNVRLEDMFYQNCATNLLLASVQAVALKDNVNLLPGWPTSRLGRPGNVRTIMESLPSFAYPLQSTDINQILSSHYSSSVKAKQAEVLLSWVSIRFRGMIIAASTGFSIPGLDGVVQYLVQDAQPENEASFAKHHHLQPRHILYHGTSIDRLYSVLVQGLQILSGTPLAQHGRVYGKGIYMAREPSYALSYAKSNIPKTTTPISQLQGDVSNAKVLLACEHAGNDTSTPRNAPRGVHVVQDPTRIMVRYIFLVPPKARVPKAVELNRHILTNVKHLRDIL